MRLTSILLRATVRRISINYENTSPSVADRVVWIGRKKRTAVVGVREALKAPRCVSSDRSNPKPSSGGFSHHTSKTPACESSFELSGFAEKYGDFSFRIPVQSQRRHSIARTKKRPKRSRTVLVIAVVKLRIGNR